MTGFLKTRTALAIFGLLSLFVLLQGGSREIRKGQEKIRLNGYTIAVERADTEAKRIQGLSGRTWLPVKTGMLFVFESAGRQGIWMKEMHFSIDILWLDDTLRIVDIKENAAPESYPAVFYPREDAWYVLEIPAGSAAAWKLKVGDEAVRLP